jgi:hypothetical protein
MSDVRAAGLSYNPSINSPPSSDRDPIMRRQSLFLLTVVVAACLPAVSSRGADAAAAGDGAVETLIAQLGSSDYSEREAAARQLSAGGPEIEARLREALRDPDLEIRLRSSEILARLSRADLDKRLLAFVDDVEGKVEHDLPGWKRYREAVGDDRAARELFVEMFRAERELLESLERPQDVRDALVNAKIERLQQSLYRGFGAEQQTPSAASLATMLLVTSQGDAKTSIHAGIQMYSLLSNEPVREVVRTGARMPQLHKLLAAWVANGITSGGIPQYPLMIALQYDLRESTLELGRKLAAEKSTSTSVLPYALLALGKYGDDRTDVKLIEPLLANTTVCHTWHNGRNPEPIKIEVRDVALAVLVHLTGQEHKAYGFELLQRYDRTLFQVHTCGYVDNAKRETAMTKWRAWSAARVQKP